MTTEIERITLAHLSDVHLSPVRGLWPQHWNAKRLLGYANWCFRRGQIHRRSVVDDLIRDMNDHKPNHVVVTGDLVNLGLPAEYEAAAKWLSDVGCARDVTVVPGNHDIYVAMKRDIGVARWFANMSSNDAGMGLVSGAASPSAVDFPFCRVVGPLALIGVNSAVATMPFYATGRVGAAQMSALGNVLDKAREMDLVRVVLIHHPPLSGLAPARRALSDASELAQVLADKGAELVLHGHNHRDSTHWFKGPVEQVPVLGVSSASAAKPHGDEPMARYNIIRIIRWNSNVRFEITCRGTKKLGGPLTDIRLQSFEVRMS